MEPAVHLTDGGVHTTIARMELSQASAFGMYDSICEVPFVASTTGGSAWQAMFGRRQQERLREQVRGQLNVQPMQAVSFGRAGTTRIEPAPVVACTRLSTIAPAASAQRFCHDLAERGVLGYIQSSAYAPATQRLRDYVQARLSSAPTDLPLAGRVNWLLCRFAEQEPQLMDWAADQQRFWECFSRDDPHFERLPGRLVRLEADEALASVWNASAKREELRSFSASEMREIGVDVSGDPFVLYDVTYVPGVRLTTVLPGVQSGRALEAAAEEEARLRRYETPLPSAEQLRARAATEVEDASERTAQSAAG